MQIHIKKKQLIQQILTLYFYKEHSFFSSLFFFSFPWTQFESFEKSLDDCRWFSADKSNDRLLSTYIFTCTTDRADCPVVADIVLKSFQVLCFWRSHYKNCHLYFVFVWVPVLSFLGILDFFFLAISIFVLFWTCIYFNYSKNVNDTQVFTPTAANQLAAITPSDPPKEEKCSRLWVVPLHWNMMRTLSNGLPFYFFSPAWYSYS